MKVKFKKVSPDAVIPSYAKPGDVGLDLTAISIIDNNHLTVTYDTGIAVEIPEGYAGFIFPRSSIRDYSLSLTNSVGAIDSNYRGSIRATFARGKDSQDQRPIYVPGERIGQLVIMPYPIIEPVEADKLSDTVRGEGGFGSTGK